MMELLAALMVHGLASESLAAFRGIADCDTARPRRKFLAQPELHRWSGWRWRGVARSSLCVLLVAAVPRFRCAFLAADHCSPASAAFTFCPDAPTSLAQPPCVFACCCCWRSRSPLSPASPCMPRSPQRSRRRVCRWENRSWSAHTGSRKGCLQELESRMELTRGCVCVCRCDVSPRSIVCCCCCSHLALAADGHRCRAVPRRVGGRCVVDGALVVRGL